MPTMASPRPRDDLGDHVAGRRRTWSALTIASARCGRVAGLEDAGADEHALGAELHHHRRVGRGGDAAGGEQHDRQLAGSARPRDQLVRRLQLLGRDVQLVLGQRASAGGSRRGSVRMCVVALDTSPVPASPLERIIAAPSVMRRSASPRLVAPHTNGTVNGPLVDVVGVVGRGEHLGLVDVVDAERLQHLGLDEVADPGLGHDRDGDRASMIPSIMSGSLIRDTPPWARMSAGTRSSAMTATAPASSAILRLLRRDDVHDHAALEHLGHAALDARRCRWRSVAERGCSGVALDTVDLGVSGHGSAR